MQSVPTYYPPTFPPTSPYPNVSAAATTTATTATSSTESPSNGTAAMAVATPPVMTATLGQNLMETDPNAAPAEPTKRNQVKNACTNCQKACKKCADARPCPRCEKYGIADTCVNSVRKERKKGIKRGPYKRRQKNGDDKNQEAKQVPAPVVTPAPPTVTVLRPAPPPPTDFGYPTQLSQYQNYETYNYAINAAAAVYNNNNPNNPHPIPVYSSYPAPVLVNGDNTNNEKTDGKHDPTSARILASLMSTNTSYLQAMNGIISNAPTSTVETTTAATDASKKPEEGTKQPTTPVPSTSNSSGTTSPSVGHEEDEKFARLSQLCSAALRENKEAQEKKAAEGTTEASSESTTATAAPPPPPAAAPAEPVKQEEMTETK